MSTTRSALTAARMWAHSSPDRKPNKLIGLFDTPSSFDSKRARKNHEVASQRTFAAGTHFPEARLRGGRWHVAGPPYCDTGVVDDPWSATCSPGSSRSR
jgi:hypothetical protein